jgi:hypothetical protein
VPAILNLNTCDDEMWHVIFNIAEIDVLARLRGGDRCSAHNLHRIATRLEVNSSTFRSCLLRQQLE